MPFPKEELLHHIWKYRLFSSQNLKTAEGQSLEVIRPGDHNTNAGPDFLNARIKLGETVWAGNIEIHIRSSDWMKHRHQNDKAYDNLILHVVYVNDLDESVGDFPTVELHPFVSDQLLHRYNHLQTNKNDIPCGKQLLQVNPLVRNAWFDSLLIERLIYRSGWMMELVDKQNGDLEQAFQIIVFRSFGMKVNAEAFVQLAKATPWKVLSKHQDNIVQLEAILFGNAGMLEGKPKDVYHEELKKEYDFLKHKYQFQSINPTLWKFLRLRPANFPSVRIAQLASMFNTTGPFLKWFSNQNEIKDYSSLSVEASGYWNTHYQFGKESGKRVKRIGNSLVQSLLINAVAPFLFVTAEREAKEEQKELALDMLAGLPPEKNARINAYLQLGLKPSDAATSQALLELRSNFCDHKKCLFCSIGVQLLKTEL